MPNIYLLASSEIYSKLFQIALKNYNVELKILSSMEEFENNFKEADLIVIDDDFTENPEPVINKCLDEGISVIYLADIFSEKEISVKESEKFIKLEKPFEEKDLVEKIKSIINLEKGEAKMPEEKVKSEEDVLELTDIVEEGSEEVSDILSTEKKKEEDKILDEFFEDEEEKKEDEEIKKEPTGAVVEDEILKEEELEKLISEAEAQEETPEKPEEPEISEQEPPQIEEPQQEQEEEIKIPVDEETKKLAEEIESEKIEDTEEPQEPEIEKSTSEPEPTPISTPTHKFKEKVPPQEHQIDFSKVEEKLLEATDRVIEAIQEATVEIAKAIAKSTPKIIEEVAKQIIPAVAKKIIAEEIEKKKEEE